MGAKKVTWEVVNATDLRSSIDLLFLTGLIVELNSICIYCVSPAAGCFYLILPATEQIVVVYCPTSKVVHTTHNVIACVNGKKPAADIDRLEDKKGS